MLTRAELLGDGKLNKEEWVEMMMRVWDEDEEGDEEFIDFVKQLEEATNRKRKKKKKADSKGPE